jgi:membrane protease YdiL (CAAX protease family)
VAYAKLASVFTEESSQQITPLSEEHAASPATVLAEEVQSTPTPAPIDWWRQWLDVGKAVLIWVVSVILLVFVPVIIALPYMVYRIFTSGGALSPEAIGSDKTLLFLSVLGILPTHLLTLVIAWMVVSEGGRRPFWKAIGFDWPEGTNKKLATMLSVGLALVLLGLAYLVTTFFGGQKTQLDVLIESSLATRFATAFVALATAPLVEEVIYRGVLYPAVEKAARMVMMVLTPALEKPLGMGIAVTFVSLLFAGVHVFQYYNNISVILVITILSITLTVVRAVTGKVFPAFIIHLVFNGIQSIILVLAPFIDKSS